MFKEQHQSWDVIKIALCKILSIWHLTEQNWAQVRFEVWWKHPEGCWKSYKLQFLARENLEEVSKVPYPVREVSSDLGTAEGGSRASRTHLTHLCCHVVSCGQVFKPEKTIPVTSATATRIMMNHLKYEIGRNVTISICGS